MSDAPEKRIVELGTAVRAQGSIAGAIDPDPPPVRGRTFAEMLAMPRDEKLEVIAAAMDDDVLILWFATLSKAVRKQFVDAATEALRK